MYNRVESDKRDEQTIEALNEYIALIKIIAECPKCLEAYRHSLKKRNEMRDAGL